MNIESMREYRIVVPDSLDAAQQATFDAALKELLNNVGGFPLTAVQGDSHVSTGKKVHWDKELERMRPVLKTLHEYSIVVPKIPGAVYGEQTLFDAKLASALLSEFGGFTMVPVTGAWKDGNGNVFYDESIEYRIGISGLSKVNHQRVRTIAHNIGVQLGEQAMYIKCPNGACEIITVGPVAIL